MKTITITKDFLPRNGHEAKYCEVGYFDMSAGSTDLLLRDMLKQLELALRDTIIQCQTDHKLLSEASIQWLNIQDSESNPEGKLGFIRCLFLRESKSVR